MVRYYDFMNAVETEIQNYGDICRMNFHNASRSELEEAHGLFNEGESAAEIINAYWK